MDELNSIYFTIEEMKCPCCGECHMDAEFIKRLDAARAVSGIPYPVNSGYRCEAHNKAEGSTSNNHTKGVATDIQCVVGHNRLRIVQGLLTAGFKRIGIANTFIHADTNNDAPSIWLY